MYLSVCVCKEYNTMQLLLDLSAHCLQPVTACHINEVAHKTINFIYAHNVCEQTSLTENFNTFFYNTFSIVQSCFCAKWR